MLSHINNERNATSFTADKSQTIFWSLFLKRNLDVFIKINHERLKITLMSINKKMVK